MSAPVAIPVIAAVSLAYQALVFVYGTNVMRGHISRWLARRVGHTKASLFRMALGTTAAIGFIVWLIESFSAAGHLNEPDFPIWCVAAFAAFYVIAIDDAVNGDDDRRKRRRRRAANLLKKILSVRIRPVDRWAPSPA